MSNAQRPDLRTIVDDALGTASSALKKFESSQECRAMFSHLLIAHSEIGFATSWLKARGGPARVVNQFRGRFEDAAGKFLSTCVRTRPRMQPPTTQATTLPRHRHRAHPQRMNPR